MLEVAVPLLKLCTLLSTYPAQYCSIINCISVFFAGEVLLKQLIPSHLAGVILGKGGETIVSIQSSTGSTIKMSKGNDFYPGT